MTYITYTYLYEYHQIEKLRGNFGKNTLFVFVQYIYFMRMKKKWATQEIPTYRTMKVVLNPPFLDWK